MSVFSYPLKEIFDRIFSYFPNFKMLLWVFFVLIPCVVCMKKECPGTGSFSCPDSTTCCQLADSSYGCCPLENAICCDDHIHCCPQKSKCEANMCVELSGMNSTAERLTKDISCDGSQYTCPDNTTCCKQSTKGTYACCPLPNAVCCVDGIHCCPENTVCDLQEEKCIGKKFISEMYDSQKHGTFMFGSSKSLSLLKPNNVSNVICPGHFQCPDGYTCCQLPDGDWGCCPFIKATCCADKLHCCPQNMQCDPTSQACSQGDVSVPLLKKEIAKPFNDLIVCPDNSTCVEGMTCCKKSPERFGCCPYEDAVCCNDFSHCCPSNYTCDLVEKCCVPNKENLIF